MFTPDTQKDNNNSFGVSILNFIILIIALIHLFGCFAFLNFPGSKWHSISMRESSIQQTTQSRSFEALESQIQMASHEKSGAR